MNSAMTGDEARTLRQSICFTQELMAKVMGVSPRTISRWETTGNIPETARRMMLMLVATSWKIPEEEA